jgi:hypothetical protein
LGQSPKNDFQKIMEYSVSITKAAEEEINSAFLWYQDQQHNLGVRFEKDISKAVASILSPPS